MDNYEFQSMYEDDVKRNKRYHGRKIGDHWVVTNTSYHIRRDLVEIHFTDSCNLNCLNCQSSCVVAPSGAMLSFDHLKKFVDDTLALGIKWTELKCTGGEPTLHPQFVEMIKEIRRCSGKLRIFTNQTPVAMRAIEKLPSDLNYSLSSQNNAKTRCWERFESMYVAPVDVPEYQHVDPIVYTYGCQRVASRHGPTLGTNGKYYYCPTLYHVDRVFDLNTGVDNLEYLMGMSDWEIRTRFYQPVCKYCGFFKYPRDVAGKEQVISPSWEKALREYRIRSSMIKSL